MWLSVSGFMVMGFVSGLSLANHSNSESFLVVHASLSQDGCWREGFWEVDGHVVSTFDFSRTLPVGGGLLVPYSLPGSPVIKQLMNGPDLKGLTRVGGFSQCVSPNKCSSLFFLKRCFCFTVSIFCDVKIQNVPTIFGFFTVYCL